MRDIPTYDGNATTVFRFHRGSGDWLGGRYYANSPKITNHRDLDTIDTDFILSERNETFYFFHYVYFYR